MAHGEKGYIQFGCEWEPADAPGGPVVAELVAWRNRLRSLGLIGVYPDGIGFGNISGRVSEAVAAPPHPPPTPVRRSATSPHRRGERCALESSSGHPRWEGEHLSPPLWGEVAERHEVSEAGEGVGRVVAARAIHPRAAFVISGTATGHLERIGAEHVTAVTSHDIPGNRLWCRGPIRASSESLSHAAVYLAEPAANAIIHVHHLGLWDHLRGVLPTTHDAAEAGTPAMADAIAGLLRAGVPGGVFVMGGHREGLMAFGRTVEEAGERLLAVFAAHRVDL